MTVCFKLFTEYNHVMQKPNVGRTHSNFMTTTKNHTLKTISIGTSWNQQSDRTVACKVQPETCIQVCHKFGQFVQHRVLPAMLAYLCNIPHNFIILALRMKAARHRTRTYKQSDKVPSIDK